MTTADKLAYLADTKESIRQAIISKGVAVPSETTFRDYADKIGDISGGGGDEVPSVSLASSEIVEGAYLNSSDPVVMNYSNVADGDTVYTVLWYYDQGGATPTVSPAGIVDVVAEYTSTLTDPEVSKVKLIVYKHVHDSNLATTISFTPSGDGRRRGNYFTVPAKEGFILEEAEVGMQIPANMSPAILMGTQVNQKSHEVFRVVVLGWAINFSTQYVRGIQAVPRGWTAITRDYIEFPTTAHSSRMAVIGVTLAPGESARYTTLNQTTISSGTMEIGHIALDLYYTPIPPSP